MPQGSNFGSKKPFGPRNELRFKKHCPTRIELFLSGSHFASLDRTPLLTMTMLLRPRTGLPLCAIQRLLTNYRNTVCVGVGMVVAYTSVVKQLRCTTLNHGDAKMNKAKRNKILNRARANMRGQRAIYPHDRALGEAIYINLLDQAAMYGPTLFKSCSFQTLKASGCSC